jgi:hypothetical protein
MGVVDGKHGRRAKQVPCHVSVQTILVSWQLDLAGGVRRLDIPRLKRPLKFDTPARLQEWVGCPSAQDATCSIKAPQKDVNISVTLKEP